MKTQKAILLLISIILCITGCSSPSEKTNNIVGTVAEKTEDIENEINIENQADSVESSSGLSVTASNEWSYSEFEGFDLGINKNDEILLMIGRELDSSKDAFQHLILELEYAYKEYALGKQSIEELKAMYIERGNSIETVELLSSYWSQNSITYKELEEICSYIQIQATPELSGIHFEEIKIEKIDTFNKNSYIFIGTYFDEEYSSYMKVAKALVLYGGEGSGYTLIAKGFADVFNDNEIISIFESLNDKQLVQDSGYLSELVYFEAIPEPTVFSDSSITITAMDYWKHDGDNNDGYMELVKGTEDEENYIALTVTQNYAADFESMLYIINDLHNQKNYNIMTDEELIDSYKKANTLILNEEGLEFLHCLWIEDFATYEELRNAYSNWIAINEQMYNINNSDYKPIDHYIKEIYIKDKPVCTYIYTYYDDFYEAEIRTLTAKFLSDTETEYLLTASGFANVFNEDEIISIFESLDGEVLTKDNAYLNEIIYFE